jgi:hypothetical protein
MMNYIKFLIHYKDKRDDFVVSEIAEPLRQRIAQFARSYQSSSSSKMNFEWTTEWIDFLVLLKIWFKKMAPIKVPFDVCEILGHNRFIPSLPHGR